MAQTNQSLPWNASPQKAYVALSYQGETVGFCRPEFAKRIAGLLNETEKLRKAFYLACSEVAVRSDVPVQTNVLVQKFLAQAERPKQGAAAIALLLKERQAELDLTAEEFAKFCDTFRLSPIELHTIFSGQEIESYQLMPLSRILGVSADELIDIWKGQS